MMITDQEATELKSWVVKKLEDISDADSDVLADYVLALIRADTPEPELRLNAIENLEDFLKENTEAFVDAIFLAIHNRSYMPGYVPVQTAPASNTPFPAPAAPANLPLQDASRTLVSGELLQSRKRSYNDRQEDAGAGDPHYGRGDRQVKQIRQGSGRAGRVDMFGSRRGRGGFQLAGTSPNIPQVPVLGFPNLPLPAPRLPFDPSDPMAAMMAMQAMGLPSFPGIPPLPPPTSPSAYDRFGAQRSPLPDQFRNTMVKMKCRDYETQGYCERGNMCQYEHNDHIIVPGQDEYDPKNSVMMDIQKTPSTNNGHGNASVHRGLPTDRGLVRGKGGFTPNRRNRAEFSHSGPNHDRSITTIVVEQIPEDRFDEKSVREFFANFGKIEEVTMQAYKRLALVKYEDYTSARKAYDSPKVIFDNRFVKVYWYKPESTSTVAANGAATKQLPTTKIAEEPAFDKEKFERDALAAQKKQDEKKALQRETEAKRQALEKQREELAQRQAEEKRKLMEKLAAKGRAESTDTGADVDNKHSTTNGTNGADDGKVSAQTKALRAQVAALEAEAKSLGLDTALTEDPWAPRGRGRGRARSSYRGWEKFATRGSTFDSSRSTGRGRGTLRGARAGGAYNLDNRTKKVGVTGVEFDEKKDEALRQYLLGIGEFEAIETQPDRTDSQVISFKDRFTAEQFMYGTKDIPGVGKLELSWVNTPSQLIRPNNQKQAPVDGDTGMRDAAVDGDNSDKAAAEVDYDVAEEDDRWMVE